MTNDRQPSREIPDGADSENDDYEINPDEAPRAAFCLENETGQRGAKPEQNSLL